MQEFAVLVIVAAAAVYLARSFYLSSRGSGCGGCAKKGCAAPKPSGPQPTENLIQISLDKHQ